MPSVPVLRPREVVRAFERLGWQVVRQRGSHIILTKPGSVVTLSVPEHDEVARGTLRATITKAGITLEEFIAAAQWSKSAENGRPAALNVQLAFGEQRRPTGDDYALSPVFTKKLARSRGDLQRPEVFLT
jgi:predicted RNA binding protein YcfA (HicA-like mRNA interferase family)